MSKKKDETVMNDAKKTEGEKKYAKLPEKVVAGLPAAAILQSNEKVMDLFARGKKRGRLDSGEMMEVLDDLDLDSDQMEKIYDSLEALSIEIGSEEDILPTIWSPLLTRSRRSRRRSWSIPTPWWTPSPLTTRCGCT